MIIRVLPSLSNRQQWIDFCRRERPYCYVRQPDTLVDMQSTFLILTLLNEQVRDGRQATKYSIGSRASLEPAWQFIKACNFDLAYMTRGLESVHFTGNARDNNGFTAAQNVSIRKFFAKEAAVISAAALGPLEPLQCLPQQWSLLAFCQLLANQQFVDLRVEQAQLPAQDSCPAQASPQAEQILRQLVSDASGWQVGESRGRICLSRQNQRHFSLRADLKLAQLRRPTIV